jgi:hypothetical protein
VFLGLGPCVINGVSYPTCSTNANLNQRRSLFLENPRNAGGIGFLDLHDDVGWQTYHGMRMTVTRRSVNGVSFSGNYTVAKCEGTATPGSFPQISAGYTNPADPDMDKGHCDQDRSHLVNATMGYMTPEFSNSVANVLASDWRFSGSFSARSGAWLNVVTGLDNALNGLTNQRPNIVSEDVYGPKTLTNYLDRAAFAQPAPGTFGNAEYRAVEGPGFWEINLAVSRLFNIVGTQSLELRVEAFNLTNNFNWGDPALNLNQAQFGRITTMAGAHRIMQFGIKYAF